MRVKLFFAILGVTLACILSFALLSNYLVHREFQRAFENNEFAFKPPPAPPDGGGFEGTDPGQERLRAINLSYLFTGILGVFLAFVLSYYLSNRISRPLSELTSVTRSIADGEYGKQVDVRGGREVEELGEAFNALSRGLERNEMLRKNMVMDVSHELRNPLAAQRGHLEALQDGVIDLDEKAVDILLKHNVLLSRLVEDLRQLSLVDARQIELDLRPVDVGDALRVVASSFEHEFSEKGISLEVDAAADIPAVPADRERISQILNNLLVNAILYTPEGGSIILGAREGEGEAIVFVTDTGPGIEEEELAFIFERFYRTDRSRTRETGGTGLGLSIAKGLVEAHGGRTWAESEVGRGTTVFFALPFAPPEPD